MTASPPPPPSAPAPAPAPPGTLYKYVGDAPHHLAILQQLQIRFTQPDDLNDPFDCVPGVEPPADVAGFVDETIARNRAIMQRSGRTTDQIALARQRMIDEYTNHPGALVERCATIVRRNLNELGVLSLAQRNDNMPLWAHYSANHAGFALALRSDGAPLTRRPGDLATEGELRPVVYQEERVVVPLDPLVLTPDVLFIKAAQWAYEEEWRIVRRLATCDRALSDSSGVARFHLCGLDPRTVARVDAGMRATDATCNAITIATAPGTPLEHVDVYKARMNAGRTGLAFDLIQRGR